MKTNISVIIPVYNDPVGLNRTIESLFAQDYPIKDFEVLICDNGSKDNTLEVAIMNASRFNNIKIIEENTVQSSYAARNRGIENAQGQIIAFIDANMTVEKNYLELINIFFENNKNIYYMGCRVEIIIDKNNIISNYNKITGFPVEEYVNYNHFAPTCCLVAKKELFEKIGNFDERLISSGDFEFGSRAYNLGYTLFYNDNITLKHPAIDDFKALIKKYFRIGRGKKQLSFYYPNKNLKLYSLVFKPLLRKSCYTSKNKKSEQLKRYNKIVLNVIKLIVKISILIGYFYERVK